MPLYSYSCPNHGEFDRVFSISEMPDSVPCPSCKKQARKIIALGHGGIRRNDSLWVRDVSKVFEHDGVKPMETVGDLKNFLQKNPHIRPQESHPALPSSMGDYEKPKPEAVRMEERRKKAIDWYRKDNSLILTSGTSA
uniref:Putative regulatory protein FmdB zinc ribbon domain-containing protein n=1 Tax=viral metagenome TaxID=1070528 RepID=A0A6H1ZMX7_9ZZZZ